MYTEMYFFYLNFSIVHISTNNVIGGLKFYIHVGDIHVEGTLSQIFVLLLSFYFYVKNRVTFYLFFQIFFINFIENQPGPI